MRDRTALELLLAECHERGGRESAEQFIAAHPEHADALRRHLAMLDVVGLAFDERPPRHERLGPFRIEGELGSGGMGVVYRAVVDVPTRGLEIGRIVALKVVHPHLFRTPGFFKRFLREAELGRRIDHPNVVRTLDADAVESGDRPQHYLVMEYVEGQTLRSLIDEVDRVPEELARQIGQDVARALVAIHAAGAVHRDLKPENVLVTRTHEVKVMDLGVARLADGQVRLSQTGAFVGSLQYAAPEQFRGGDEVDARADLHGLGLLLYEITTGTNPFADEDARVAMRRILSEPPRRLGELNPQISPFLEEFVHRLLQKDAAARFPSAAEALAVLDAGEASAWWKERALALRTETRRPLRRVRVPRETAVYGRDAEMARLRVLFDRAKAGDGRVVLVEGEAGIGKTRLVDEFVARLQQEGEDLNFLFGSYPPGGAATASGAFSTAFREHVGDIGLEAALTALLPQTPILVPAFAALLRGDAAPQGAEPLTKDSLQTCFAHLTRSLAAERTTIVLIDDLHFAPEEGRALLTSLALAVPGYRILLVGTMRPGVPEAWTSGLTRLDQTTSLSIPRLGPKDLVRLLGDSFRSERLAEELAGKIAVKSDGNPFFVFEILRGLREGQFIAQREDGSWHTTRLVEDIQVPSSVLDLVNARVADLDDEDRNLLDVAACWGYEFDPSLVGAALGLARLPVLQRLARIEKHNRLVRSRGRSFVFDHHQVQEALYGSLNEQLREEYHAALATALETLHGAEERDPESVEGEVCVELCDHFLRGGRGERAVRYLARAQGHLPHVAASQRAIDLAERALHSPGLLAGLDRARVLHRMFWIGGISPLSRLGRIEREEQVARECVDLASAGLDEELRDLAEVLLADNLTRPDRPGGPRLDEAETLLERVLQSARRRGAGHLEARASTVLGGVRGNQGRLAEAQSLLESAETRAREWSDVRTRAVALANLAWIRQRAGEYQEVLPLLEQSAGLFRELGDRVQEVGCCEMSGVCFAMLGRLAEARAQFELALVTSRAWGDRRRETSAITNLCALEIQCGAAEAPLSLIERGLALCREIDNRQGEAGMLINWSIVLLLRGRLREAREKLRSVLDLSRRTPFVREETVAEEALARVHTHQGRLRDARGCLQRAELLRRKCGSTGNGDGEVFLPMILRDEGHLVEARDEARRLAAQGGQRGGPSNAARASVQLGASLAALGQVTEANRVLADTHASAAEAGDWSVVAGALLELAIVAAEQDDPTEALDRADRALEAYRRHGDAIGIADARLLRADLCRRAGAVADSRDAAEAARASLRDQDRPPALGLACAVLACVLPTGSPEQRAAVEEALGAIDPIEPVAIHRHARLLLWQATGDRSHLVEAKRLLDDALARVPAEHHEAMRTNVRVNREILAAWAEGGDPAAAESA